MRGNMVVLGPIEYTLGVETLLTQHDIALENLVLQHVAVHDEDLAYGRRVVSVHRHHDPDWVIWVLTPERSHKAICMLPQEYRHFLSTTDRV